MSTPPLTVENVESSVCELRKKRVPPGPHGYYVIRATRETIVPFLIEVKAGGGVVVPCPEKLVRFLNLARGEKVVGTFRDVLIIEVPALFTVGS